MLPKDNSPALSQSIVQRNLGHLDILQNLALIPFINNIVFIGANEQEMASIQKGLVREMRPVG